MLDAAANGAIDSPRKDLSDLAPRCYTGPNARRPAGILRAEAVAIAPGCR